jgi:hypothetical protein
MNTRQIKFRIWNVKTKKFLDEDPFYSPWAVSLNGKAFNGRYDCKYEEDEYIIQQFTELYDKNKKPIYEGDRVKFGYTGDHDFYGEVIWLEDRASFGVKTGNAFETFEGFMEVMDLFEVVGNILEAD